MWNIYYNGQIGLIRKVMCNQRNKNLDRERITLQFACGATSDSEVGSSRIQDFIILNLFQHLTSLAYSLFINKILKQVQDDTIRNFRKELFNHSTLQLFNSCESSPHPNLAPLWFLPKERERAWIFYTSLKDDCKKERENPVTNLTPLFQCKTWRTLPC